MKSLEFFVYLHTWGDVEMSNFSKIEEQSLG